MLADNHIHAVAHGEYRYSQGWLQKFIDRARELGIKEIGFSEHDEYANLVKHEVINEIKKKNPDIYIRTGLEIDYISGREDEIRHIINEFDYDYTIGSVHFIDKWAFDHPDYKERFATEDIDAVYARYFQLVQQAVETKLFDIVGHIDLIKKWGYRPKKHDILYYISPVLESIKAAGMAVEINSSGLRKEVKEVYPEIRILEEIKSLGIPVTLGSDAHHPQEVGAGLQEAVLVAKQAGIEQIVRFDKKRKLITQL